MEDGGRGRMTRISRMDTDSLAANEREGTQRIVTTLARHSSARRSSTHATRRARSNAPFRFTGSFDLQHWTRIGAMNLAGLRASRFKSASLRRRLRPEEKARPQNLCRNSANLRHCSTDKKLEKHDFLPSPNGELVSARTNSIPSGLIPEHPWLHLLFICIPSD